MNRGQSEARLELILAGGGIDFRFRYRGLVHPHSLLETVPPLSLQASFLLQEERCLGMTLSQTTDLKKNNHSTLYLAYKGGLCRLVSLPHVMQSIQDFWVFPNLNLAGSWLSFSHKFSAKNMPDVCVCIYISGTKRVAGSYCSVLEN